jgi:hypothetical protein
VDGRAAAVSEGAAKAIPCTNPPDINGDGAVDFCDTVLYLHDLASGSLRSDFNCDGRVDLADNTVYGQHYCEGPSPVATPSGSTIGVYFDEAGTITQLDNVPMFAYVDAYVVAHNAPDLGGYTFDLQFSNALLNFQQYPPAGSVHVGGFNTTALHPCVRGGESFCLPAGETTVLMHYRWRYSTGQNLTIGILPYVDCGSPSEHPAYVSCGGSCDWNYFDPAAIGMAVVNPVDFNENGLADIFEVPGFQYYQIHGASEGTGWSMGIRDPGGNWGPYYSMDNVLPVGAPASEFVAAFVAWLNTVSPSVHAATGFSDDMFYVSIPGTGAFELGVGAFGVAPDCWVSLGTECSFNPTLAEIADPATGVPERSVFGLANYPNPFNPRTTISFELPDAARVDLSVYDPAGRLVRTLISGRDTRAGHHESVWDGCDESGNVLAAGLYIYRLDAGNRSEASTMILLK